jgi:hypothetical protein
MTSLKPRGKVRLKLLVPGIAAGSLLLACDDPSSPFAELDGVLAYSEPGAIHVLDLSDGTDEIIYSAQTGTDIRNPTWRPILPTAPMEDRRTGVKEDCT